MPKKYTRFQSAGAKLAALRSNVKALDTKRSVRTNAVSLRRNGVRLRLMRPSGKEAETLVKGKGKLP